MKLTRMSVRQRREGGREIGYDLLSRIGVGVRRQATGVALMGNWTIHFIKAGQDREFRDSGSVSRETALRQAGAYLRQGSDVLRVVGPDGQVILLDEIQCRSDQRMRA